MFSTLGDNAEIIELREKLAEAQATLQAIRTGHADALIDAAGNVFQRPGAEKPYATFFAAMNEGAVTVDQDGAILHCNPRFERMLGFPVDQLRRSTFTSYFAPEERDHFQSLLTNAAVGSWESEIQTARGALPVRLSITAMRAEHLDFSCVVVTDLTERVKADAELRIAAIAFESQEATSITDAQGKIVRVNQAFTRLTGFTGAEAVGNRHSILHSGRHDNKFYQELWKRLIESNGWQGEIWNRHKNGKIYPHWLTISAVCNASGVTTHYVGVLSEITKNKEAEAEIHRLAYYDALTGLPNRRLLLDRLSQAVIGTTRSGQYGAVLFLDLDFFKTLNDTRGHDAGDILLREVAQRLRHCVRGVDTVSRLGGDEFLLLLEDLGTDAATASMQARHIGEKVREVLGAPYEIQGRKAIISASIGASLFRDDETTVEDLLKHADLALYKAKDLGRNTLQFFDPALQAVLDERVALETDLRSAIDANELFLAFQPQLDVTGKLVSAEALLRWYHPERGMVSPKDFIPMAEKFGQIIAIGNWVLTRACLQLNAWAKDPLKRDLKLAVNVSQSQFRRQEFVSEVQLVLNETGANPQLLKIELTESMLIEDVNSAMAKMQELNNMGIGISIDDFGTGYSSLSYLMRLPIEQLKIDQSFVTNLPQDARDAVVTKTIIDMARNLSLNVIAEGVESKEQLEFLKELGCHAFQGFLFSQALPADEFDDFVKEHNIRSL